MSLERSAWVNNSPEKKFKDYILILPEVNVIVSFTSMQDESDRRVVWGCWIREEADFVVNTALKNAKVWRRESYEMQEGKLIWHNGAGTSIWTRMPESDIPQDLRERGMKFLEKLGSHIPPTYPTAQ